MLEKESTTDFGNILSRDQFKSREVNSLEEVLEFYQCSPGVVPVGSRHTMMGQTLSSDKVPLKRIGEHSLRVSEGIIIASSHTKIIDIDAKLSALGLEVPVSPDHRDLTLGGVLSVGGYDPMSVRRGALVDSVESITAVNSQGEVVKGDCSEFLCTLGESGFIWEASIRAAPSARSVFCTSLDINHGQYTKMLPELIGDVSVIGFHFGMDANGSRLEIVKKSSGNLEILDYRKHRKKVTDSWVFQNVTAFRPWSDTFVPVEKSSEFFDFCIEQAHSWDLHESMWSLFSIACKKGNHPHFPHSIGTEYAVGVGLYANIPLDMRKKMISVVDSQFKISEFASGLGGKPCLHGWKKPDSYAESAYETLLAMGM